MQRPFLALFLAVLAACGKSDDGRCEHGSRFFWADQDGDGFGDASASTSACDQPSGSVDNGDDCNDASAAIHPGAAEVCNGFDDDCDGAAEPEPSTWFVDGDGDGYGSTDETTGDCEKPDGFVARGGDCDDTTADVHPSATEVCNDIDDDCNDAIDDPFDADGDGHIVLGCGSGDDCDDADAEVHPGATERCGDGIDGDCVAGDSKCVSFSGSLSLADADSKTYAEDANQEFGRVLDVGDVNGDGETDVVGGAETINDYLGGGYILYGPLSGTHGASEVGYRLENTTSAPTLCGRSAALGDVNGDGYDDVGLGGRDGVRLEFGPIDGDVDLADASIHAFGTPTTSLFGHGHDLGDVNDDGEVNLVVGAHGDGSSVIAGGAVYVSFGPVGSGELDMVNDNDVALVDNTVGEQVGRIVKVGGDFNADGFTDVLVQSHGYTPTPGGSAFGATFVLFGPIDTDRPLDEPDAILAPAVPGFYPGDDSSQADVDGDGISDAAVGAPAMWPGDVYTAGTAYVVLGPISGLVDLDGDADFKVYGTTEFTRVGSGVALADVTGDALADFLVGAPMIDGHDGVGAAYYFEAPLGGSVAVEGAAAVFAGEDPGASAGMGVHMADLDHNGTADLLIGAPYEETGGVHGGAIYTFLAD